MVYKFFDKESTSFVQKPAAGGGLNELVDELYKPIITKFKIFKIYSSFKGLCIYCVSLIVLIKFSRDVLLKDKKVITTFNAFESTLNNSKRKPNKIWVDQGSDFYNKSFKKWLHGNDIEVYSTYNEGKSCVTEGVLK